ncbi:epoxyqueuosine reductase QueH [Parabacteroides sp. PF5-9]|uniref:epoxyqueuosine reductase QueH n=1 Tax=Parabacteroides sp. PF5-9 TaxID=1742404 RepID=UPI002476600E|nr:epoxyqueuosine reductase QueH [Parabacteroides sp. PF5-9]MDH6356917.1 putative adenine nucleotide alpha hydrolase (AANH) superfamily ATPase [Parabacteroides sp. PF5-9]
MKPRLLIDVPEGQTDVLLHTCCAPCSAAIIECLLENGIRPVIFYFNPNIFPLEEYEIRKAECTRYAQSFGLTIIDRDYDHSAWSNQIQGLEQEPERGRRCQQCFNMRLMETARYGAENNIAVFTTTLASSRWKNLEQINQAGNRAAKHYPSTIFWEQNWRKGGLSERRKELLQEYGFYNQRYCGCEFSLRNSK